MAVCTPLTGALLHASAHAATSLGPSGHRAPGELVGGEAAGHELDEGRAHALLKQACGIAGLDADGARLMRLGSNAVYHLARR